MKRNKLAPLLGILALLSVACGGHAVVVFSQEQAASLEAADSGPAVDVGGKSGKGRGGPTQDGGGPGTASAGLANCATTSNPDEGFTEDTLKIGTIMPLSGPLRPIAEQNLRVIRLTIQNANRTVNIPGPLEYLNWGCPTRPGIFGRKIELEVYSLQTTTPEEALAGMRRLIDVEKVFLVRDCYLQDSLMGPATQYQNSKGVPGVYCHAGSMPVPALAPWTFYPSTDPLTQTAIHVGYLMNILGRERLGVIADPNDEDTLVATVRRVAEHFDHPIPDSCVILKRSQEAANGMRSEIARLRTCYNGQSPDAVFAGDALQAVFGALEAKSQGWRPADANVQWACTNPTCWVISLAEICGDACEGIITDCAALPCVPWADPADFPAVQNLRDTRADLFPGEPEDAATYGPAAISGGIAYWLTMTGPDLSREKFRATLDNLRDFSSGIGPVINISPANHFGAYAIWLVEYLGGSPWFDDLSRGFVTIEDVGVPQSVVFG
ncbi:MAG: ABC transporter substrate-binding protein [Actinomycetota bacterium]